MLLDSLRNFSWYNEPQNVRFNEEGMVVEAKPQTDFWQSKHHNFHKDDGHFFFNRISGDFTLTLKWSFEKAFAFAQCGIMVRIDNLNWAKAGILAPDLNRPQLGTIVTNHGASDWAVVPLASKQEPLTMWYRLRRRNGDFIFYYSFDGNEFYQIRLFHLLNISAEVKAGAYICSPQLQGFSGTLEMVDFS